MKFPRFALFAPCLLGLLACTYFASAPTITFDIVDAQRTGVVVREALTLGSKGDWDGARDLVAGQDELVRDIVMWRKLHARAGTIAEYEAHVARRSHWPGGSRLASIYARHTVPPTHEAMGPTARKNYRKFTSLYNRRRYNAAATFLAGITGDVQALGAPSRWADRRRRLTRRAIRKGDPQKAYTLASSHFLDPSEGHFYADLEWIAGWIAFKMLNEPNRAAEHFERLAAAVRTPISRGRAGYWAGRAYEAMGDRNAAKYWYRVGARYQTSFYGQLAAAKVEAKPDQDLATPARVRGRVDLRAWDEDARLAGILHFADKKRLAVAVLTSTAKRLTEPAEFDALGGMALDLEHPHYAVRIGKAAAFKGIVLPRIYFPLHELATYSAGIEPAFAMSVARQETELDPEAVSAAGARGLMQLLPATARNTARRIGEKYSRAGLTRDWRYNARLGQAYMAQLVDAFDGSYLLAVAAYNAGPRRVRKWIKEIGDPLRSGTSIEAIVDWTEQIPLRETRNYVQRVMEGLYIYRARLSGRAEPITIERDLRRGMR